MRASSLANAKIIALLNRYYVPVYVSNEDYARTGSAAAEEKAERNRIWQEAAKKGLSSGTVHVYILAPDGHVIDSLHVATASKVDQTLALLQRNVEKLKTAAGKPLVAPAPQSACPKVAGDCLVLHLTERNLQRQDTFGIEAGRMRIPEFLHERTFIAAMPDIITDIIGVGKSKDHQIMSAAVAERA